MKCQLYKLLFNFFPLKKIKVFMIRKHFNQCEQCQIELPSYSQLSVLFTTPSWIPKENDMWPEIKTKLNSDWRMPQSQPNKANLFFPAWGWMAVVLFLSLAACIFFFTVFHPSREKISPAAISPEATVKVKYGEIKGEKARYHVYQTEEKYYILFLKSQNSGG